MSVPVQESPQTAAVGNGITTAFAFDFLCLLGQDLRVTIDGALIDPSQYAVGGLGLVQGGTVTFMIAPADGAAILMELAVVPERQTNYADNGDLFADTINFDFDRLWLAVQSSFLYIWRALRVPAGESIKTLPKQADRANHALGFDANGDPVAIPSDLPQIEDALARAQQSADDSAASAVDAEASNQAAAAQVVLAAAQVTEAAAQADRAEDEADRAHDAADLTQASSNTVWRATLADLETAMSGKPADTPGVVTSGDDAGYYIWDGSTLTRLPDEMQPARASVQTQLVDQTMRLPYFDMALLDDAEDPGGDVIVDVDGNVVPPNYDPGAEADLDTTFPSDMALLDSADDPGGQVTTDMDGNVIPSGVGGASQEYSSARDTGTHFVYKAPISDGPAPIYSVRKSDGLTKSIVEDLPTTDLAVSGDNVYFNASDFPRAGGYFVPVDGGPIVPVLSLPTVLAQWGDSLTAAAEAQASLRAAFPEFACNFYGIGGQTSDEIAARQGGRPATVVLPGAEIPATGTVTLTSISYPFLLIRSQPTTTQTTTGTLAGVHGTMTATSETAYSFTRDIDGDAVACPDGTPFIPDIGDASRDMTQGLWAGTNDVTYGVTPAELVSNVNAMVAYLRPLAKRVYVIGPFNRSVSTPQQYADIIEMESLLEAGVSAGGYVFGNFRRYLIDQGLQDAGITPTSQDLDDIANDIIPTSLRADTVHLNSAGYALYGPWLRALFISKGWI